MTLSVKKSLKVPLNPEKAFDLFTLRIGDWWPLETHSVSGNSAELDPAQSIRFEPGSAGRIVETLADGSDSVWAHVTRWERPSRFELAWYPSDGPDVTTRVDVRFSPEDDGTRIDLVHDGFEV
ncbi:MAG: SRPBCC domain-containing protein, partial [Pseudomonadota bacterium]